MRVLTLKQERILRHKLKKSFIRDEWYGFLTAVERQYILQRLPHLNDHQKYDLECCKKYIANGWVYPRWFYFKRHPRIDHILKN